MPSTTSFSRVPRAPMAPGSSPPWPASMAMMTSRPRFGRWGTGFGFGLWPAASAG